MTGAQLHHLRTRLLGGESWERPGVSLHRFATVVGSTEETIRGAEARGQRPIPGRLQRRLVRSCWWHLHLGALRGAMERVDYDYHQRQQQLAAERTP